MCRGGKVCQGSLLPTPRKSEPRFYHPQNPTVVRHLLPSKQMTGERPRCRGGVDGWRERTGGKSLGVTGLGRFTPSAPSVAASEARSGCSTRRGLISLTFRGRLKRPRRGTSFHGSLRRGKPGRGGWSPERIALERLKSEGVPSFLLSAQSFIVAPIKGPKRAS